MLTTVLFLIFFLTLQVCETKNSFNFVSNLNVNLGWRKSGEMFANYKQSSDSNCRRCGRRKGGIRDIRRRSTGIDEKFCRNGSNHRRRMVGWIRWSFFRLESRLRLQDLTNFNTFEIFNSYNGWMAVKHSLFMFNTVWKKTKTSKI